ncbi:MAG TPA: LEA type 2 family protein [Blastocatellia bacterium]|nr:LEA type 2 family protein [Blastocatellia bacterium]
MLLKLKISGALLLILALAGVARAADKQPAIKLKGIALKHLDVTSLVADTMVTIEIENPGQAFIIKGASYRLKLNDHDAAEGHHDEAINVPAESSVTVDLPLTVNLAALPGVTWRTIADGLNLNYELAVEFDVPLLGLFTRKMQTSFSGTLPIGDMALGLPGKLKEKLFGKP